MNTLSEVTPETCHVVDGEGRLPTAPAERAYLLAITPRSGSSYLCDVLKKTKCLGVPSEYLNLKLQPNKMVEKNDALAYMDKLSGARRTKNNLFGIKSSWFDFNNFIEKLEHDIFSHYRFIYLTRRNLEAQAVSLYKATSSGVFHTNVIHEDKNVNKLRSLDYDFNEIDRWYRHLVKQEDGWRNYFQKNKIFPCCITYEEIDEDVTSVVLRIASYMGVLHKNMVFPQESSVFRKVSDSRNIEWTSRYMIERMQRRSV